MLQLPGGTYFGVENKSMHLDGVTITDTEYTHAYVDWHTHQNPYFTYLLTGHMQETNKKGTYDCTEGTLLFHNWQDAHYNIKPPGYTRGFHIEINQEFADRYQIPLQTAEGSMKLDNPVIKVLFRRMYMQTRFNAPIENLSISESLFGVFGMLTLSGRQETSRQPHWVPKVREVLHEYDPASLTWNKLAEIARVHPVHLSRMFPKYFNTTVGNYLKKLRIERAAEMLRRTDLSLTRISYDCGFADQSHFTRSFKSDIGVTPLHYRKLIPAR